MNPDSRELRVQAMEHDRNEPQRIPSRRVRDPAPLAPQSDDIVRWVAAGIVAAAALLGLAVLAAMISFALEPPRWVQIVLGIALVLGTVFFAWLLESALRKADGEVARRSRRR